MKKGNVLVTTTPAEVMPMEKYRQHLATKGVTVKSEDQLTQLYKLYVDYRTKPLNGGRKNK